MYYIVIQSLNTRWKLNRAQLSKFPIYEKCFGFGEYRNESTMKEETNEDGTKTIIHTLFKEEFYSTESLKPEDIRVLQDAVSWIFILEENKWNDSQRRVYNLLNPEYEIENPKPLYKCKNCEIYANSPNEIEGKCSYYRHVVGTCETKYKTLDSHCWRLWEH